MKKFIVILLLVIVLTASADAADVGISISVGQPGFYGQLDIGNFPPPRLIYPEPIVVVPPRGEVSLQPIYVRAPPGHEREWKKHCRKYNACGRPVYFVRDQWYRDVYMPEYQARQKHNRDRNGDNRNSKFEDQKKRGQHKK